jgi:hypothetical protein
MSNVAQLDLPETVIVLSALEVCLRGDVIANIKDQTTVRALVTRLAAALEAEAERRARAGLDPITPEELERFEIGDAGPMLDMARAGIMKP